MLSYPSVSSIYNPGGRLTLVNLDPLSSTDTSGTVIRYTNYLHNRIQLWDGYNWVTVKKPDADVIYDMSGSTVDKNYDIFGVLSGNSLTLETLVWSNWETRATAITLQDGRYCKSGDKRRLWLGTVRYITGNTIDDSLTKRHVYNAYNRIPKTLRVKDTTNSWTFSSAFFRAANNSTSNSVSVLAGNYEAVNLTAYGSASNATGGVLIAVGISTNTGLNDSGKVAATSATVSNVIVTCSSIFRGLQYGAWTYYWTEYGGGSGTTTWYGDNGDSTTIQNGIMGNFEC